MTSRLIDIITSPDPAMRNRSLDAFCRSASLAELLAECASLDAFRRASDNLYERVRALFFLYAIHRFHIPLKPGLQAQGFIPWEGYAHLLQRRFEEAIDTFLRAQASAGAERGDLERAGRGVSPARLPDAGRPGAPQRALGARQPVDVPRGPSGRSAAARPA